MTRGKWTLFVVENDESPHAEVCDFACSAALRDLFMRRLRVGTALTGDDAGLTRLRCAEVRLLLEILRAKVPAWARQLLEMLRAKVQDAMRL